MIRKTAKIATQFAIVACIAAAARPFNASANGTSASSALAHSLTKHPYATQVVGDSMKTCHVRAYTVPLRAQRRDGTVDHTQDRQVTVTVQSCVVPKSILGSFMQSGSSTYVRGTLQGGGCRTQRLVSSSHQPNLYGNGQKYLPNNNCGTGRGAYAWANANDMGFQGYMYFWWYNTLTGANSDTSVDVVCYGPVAPGSACSYKATVSGVTNYQYHQVTLATNNPNAYIGNVGCL